jgi:hypothetical protein
MNPIPLRRGILYVSPELSLGFHPGTASNFSYRSEPGNGSLGFFMQWRSRINEARRLKPPLLRAPHRRASPSAGAPEILSRWHPGELPHSDLKADLEIGDVGSKLTSFAQHEPSCFVGHARRFSPRDLYISLRPCSAITPWIVFSRLAISPLIAAMCALVISASRCQPGKG